jgi:hypothetical protein
MHPVDDPPAKRRRVVGSITIASVVIGLGKHSPAFFFMGENGLEAAKGLAATIHVACECGVREPPCVSKSARWVAREEWRARSGKYLSCLGWRIDWKRATGLGVWGSIKSSAGSSEYLT